MGKIWVQSWKELGLYDFIGSVKGGYIHGKKSLASANDSGASWYKIAEFIRSNPEKVFNKSV